MPGRRHVLKAALGLWGLRLLPPALRPSASAAARPAGRGVHLVGGWILVDRDLARLRG
jgi:hypothetical protein